MAIPALVKMARIFGESVDTHVLTGRDIPMSDRVSEYARYSKLKAKEQPSSAALATLLGGGIGAAAGALAGSKGNRAAPAALLGLSGGAMGLLLALADKHNVRQAQKFMSLPPSKRGKEARRQVVGSLAGREEAEESRRFHDSFRREMRHQELMDELRRR